MNAVLIAFLVSVVGGSVIPSWSTSENAPCFVNEDEDPVTTEKLHDSLDKISARLIDLKFKVETTLERMTKRYCRDISDDEIETATFTDYSMMNATRDRDLFIDDFCHDTTSFQEKMREHYDMLNQLANYFQCLRDTALDKSSMETLKSTQNYIYGVMCSIKSALRSVGQDPVTVVPSGNPSDTFTEYSQGTINRCKQQTSEFVTMLDSRRLSTYLYELYISFITSDLQC